MSNSSLKNVLKVDDGFQVSIFHWIGERGEWGMGNWELGIGGWRGKWEKHEGRKREDVDKRPGCPTWRDTIGFRVLALPSTTTHVRERDDPSVESVFVALQHFSQLLLYLNLTFFLRFSLYLLLFFVCPSSFSLSHPPSRISRSHTLTPHSLLPPPLYL